MEALNGLWDQAVSQLLAEEQSQKSSHRKVKELQTRLQAVNRTQLLSQYYRRCQRRYYRSIEAYVHSNDLYRTSMRAFVFTTRRAEEGCAPEFRYLPSTEDMLKIVQTSVGKVDL